MASEPARAYVWIWLPGAVEPVVAGVLETAGELIEFTYGRSYLERSDAIPLYLPELPLQHGRQRPPGGMRVAGVIQDAGPDSWGQRILMHRLLGRARREEDPADLGLLTYLLESASNRTGALDFQVSPDNYTCRDWGGTLEELLTAAELFDAGQPLSDALEAALLGGSSLGGARPKATLIDDAGRQLIAKFSSVDDHYPVVKAEGLAMELARRIGLTVANTQVIECRGRDVLIAERFDRTAVPGERRMMVSALTILELDEMNGRYATYYDLADAIRSRFRNARNTLRELFSRIVFNICIGNTDDHARNHSAFWDGQMLELTPAYDLTPMVRSGGETRQAMAIGRNGYQMSQLAGCISHAETYLLSRAEAKAIIDFQLEVVRSQYQSAAETVRLTEAESAMLRGSAILAPYALESYS